LATYHSESTLPKSAFSPDHHVANTSSLHPLGDRLLLRVPPAPDKVGSLYLPASAQQDFVVCQAEVVARGDHVRDGRLQPGAHLIVRRFGRSPLGDNTFAVREADVLAIVDVS